MRLQAYVLDTSQRIRAREPWQQGWVYASCAERFFPLYPAFSEAEQWGDAGEVRRQLDLAWAGPLSRIPPTEALESRLSNLLENTPHADDFDSVETTFAQNVCLLISASHRSTAGMPDPGAIPVDGAFEILRVAECVEKTGFLDLGDSPQARGFEAEFMASRLFKREVALLEQDLSSLSGQEPSGTLVSTLRDRAISNAYDVGELLPTQAAL